MNLYHDSGYLNVPEILQLRKRDIYFYVLLGARRIGKTYGALKYLLENKKRFVFVRRLASELEAMAGNVELNPFAPIDPTVRFERADKYTFNILRGEGEEQELVGIAASLSSFAKIRGFNGDSFDWLLFDEFIPERHVQKIKNEGAALLNLYTTINSNRELQGREPLKMLLLANSNDLSSNILAELNITDKIDMMIKKKQEHAILTKAHLFILMANSSPIADKRKKTALYSMLSSDSEFYKMSIENEFSYNDRSNVRSLPQQEYKPLCKMMKGDRVVFTIGKGSAGYYLHKMDQKTREQFEDSETGRKLFNATYKSLYWEYVKGKVVFQTYSIKNKFLDIFENS